MSVYKLYGAAPLAATSNSIATLDIQNEGIITAMFMFVDPDGMDALNNSIVCEVSFLSVNTILTNDTRGSLMLFGLTQQFLTSGGGVGGGGKGMSNLNIPVSAGERIHMHTITGGGVTGDCTTYLYVDDGVDSKRPRRRR